MTRVVRIVMVAMLGLVSACGTQRPYPESWPVIKPPATADCQHINGIYSDRGEMPGYTAKPSFAGLFFGYKRALIPARQVSIAAVDAAAVDVVISGEAGEIFRKRLQAERGEFTCASGRAVIRDSHWADANVAYGRESVEFELHPVDDQLIVKVKDQFVGLLLIVIPLYGESTNWYRFERFTQGTSKGATP